MLARRTIAAFRASPSKALLGSAFERLRGVQSRGDTGKERAEKCQEKCQYGLREETARGGCKPRICPAALPIPSRSGLKTFKE